MLDGKRFLQLGIFLLLVIGVVGTVSFFGVGDSSITGATVVEIGEVESCIDNSNNEFVQGEVTITYSGGSSQVYNDVCESSSILIEYSCSETGISSEQVICACSSGACL